MNKKRYEKPMMKVVELQHQCHILSGSNYKVNVTTGLRGMGYDDDLGDAAQTGGTGLMGMGADEDL
jgi:hypothetical protein